ncbi:hypothetical protein J8281_15815 [Aquimarina sp. U1-2]|uniref:hypothetical protein n=1 Tax=Aquimarina sp. U1-2 TaxID=2823141 RepID=UPI001AECA6AB|nr:hypothetical protein [Aquimarina sp. U1-2]MBP2833663.1 hypothetical protein [Aquimarina sp. U1-2]
MKKNHVLAAFAVLSAMFISCEKPEENFNDVHLESFEATLPLSKSYYGEIRTIRFNKQIPRGWITVRINTISGNRTIKNLNGGNYGVYEFMNRNSPLPEGWVITDVNSVSGSRRIRNLNGAWPNARAEAHRISPIPRGWRVYRIGFNGYKNIIYERN